jgi:hypothetical protein
VDRLVQGLQVASLATMVYARAVRPSPDEADGPVRQGQQVVEVAAHIGGGRRADVVGGRLDPPDLGQHGEQ